MSKATAAAKAALPSTSIMRLLVKVIKNYVTGSTAASKKQVHSPSGNISKSSSSVILALCEKKGDMDHGCTMQQTDFSSKITHFSWLFFALFWFWFCLGFCQLPKYGKCFSENIDFTFRILKEQVKIN